MVDADEIVRQKLQSEDGEFMKWHVHWRGGPDRTGVGLAVKLARPVGARTRQDGEKGEAEFPRIDRFHLGTLAGMWFV